MTDSYAITFARSARKELQRLDVATARRIVAKIDTLAVDARPRSCRKIRGQRDLWRLRVGDYRVIYSVDDAEKIIDVIAIRPRRDAYR
jgi:mRNA interferase RelE/StbE